VHAEPPLPHADGAALKQLPLKQQPLGQVVALQLPPAHAAPTQLAAPQAGFIPQRHTPSLEQLSALFELQVLQALPAVPHCDSEGVLHVPEQQPFGHVPGPQAMVVQFPVGPHCWPSGQGLLVPHPHLPSVQMFERTSHATHAAPFFSQVARAGVVHTPP
jgi:hypothetical protein